MRPNPNNTDSWLTAFLCWMRRHTASISILVVIGLLLHDLPVQAAAAQSGARPAAAVKLAALPPVNASFLNGSFEQWSGGAPTGWTVDGSVAQEAGLSGTNFGAAVDLGSSLRQRASEASSQVSVTVQAIYYPDSASLSYSLLTLTVNGQACAFKVTTKLRQLSCASTVGDGVLDVAVARDSGATGTVVVDELTVTASGPTATPSVTPSAAPSATRTLTPSATPSTTPTLTPSVTPSVTPTVTPSVTPTNAPLPAGLQNPGFEEWLNGQPAGWTALGTVQQRPGAQGQGSSAALYPTSSLRQRFAQPSAPVMVYVEVVREASGTSTVPPTLSMMINGAGCTFQVLENARLSCPLTLRESVAELTLSRSDSPSSMVVTIDNVQVVSGDATPPSVPANLRLADRSDTGLSLAWDASSDDYSAVVYEIAANGQTMATTDQTSASLTGLTPATSYTLAVVARDGSGNRSAPSGALEASTLSLQPVAASTVLTTNEDLPLSYDLTPLLTVSGDGAFQLAIAAPPQHGQASLLGATLTYTPTQDYYGGDALTYHLEDEQGGSADGLISLVIRPVNDPPVVTVNESEQIVILPRGVWFVANVSDVENDTLAYTWDFGDGDTSSQPSVSHRYGNIGRYTARLTVDDGHGGRSSVLQTAIVTNMIRNLPPETRTGALNWTPAGGSGALDLATLASDPNGDALTFSLVEQPKLGSASLSGSVLTYSATGIYTDTAEIRYLVDDGRGGSAEGIVRTSRPDLVPEGNVVVGLDGVAVGAATGAVTASVQVSITAALSLPVGLPSRFVPRGAAYRLSAAGDTQIVDPQQPLLVGLPVPANVPTDSLALAVYAPDPNPVTTGVYSPWRIQVGSYDALNRVYIQVLPHLKREGVVVTLVSTEGYEPLKQMLYVSPPVVVLPPLQAQPSALAEAGRQIGASVPAQTATDPANQPFVIAYAEPVIASEAIDPSLLADYARTIPEAMRWYRDQEFYAPVLPKMDVQSTGDLSAKILFPRPIEKTGSYNLFEMLPTGKGDCGLYSGMYYSPKDKYIGRILLCYDPEAKGLTKLKKETIVHELAHAVQNSRFVLRKQYRDYTKYFFEGTARVLQATWPGDVPKRSKASAPWIISYGLTDSKEPSKAEDYLPQYSAQDFWLYWMQKYGHNHISYLGGNDLNRNKGLFLETLEPATVHMHNQFIQRGISGGLPGFYWDWIRAHTYENWTYLGNEFAKGLCQPNTDAIVVRPSFNVNGQESAQIPRFDISSQFMQFTLASETPKLAAWYFDVRIQSDQTIQRVRITVDHIGGWSNDLRVAFYRNNNSCAPGDAPTRTFQFDVPQGVSTVRVLVANVDMYSLMLKNSIRVTLETAPTPVDDDRTNTEIKPSTPVEFTDLLDNDLPDTRRTDLRISAVKALNLDDRVDILPGERGVKYTPPTVVYAEDCDGTDNVATRTTAFLYWIKYSDGSLSSAKFARVSVKVQAKCLYAVPDFAKTSSSKEVKIEVLKNDKYSKANTARVKVIKEPLLGQVSKSGEDVKYKAKEVESCDGGEVADFFNYRFGLDPAPEITYSNVTTVTVTIKTKENKALCDSKTIKVREPVHFEVPDGLANLIMAGLIAGILGLGLGIVCALGPCGAVGTVVAAMLIVLIFTSVAMPASVALADGDPHLVTFDGLARSPQTLGEFTYAASPPTLRLQARHERLTGFAPWSSFVTAAAVRTDSYTFELRLPPSGLLKDPLVLLVNGKPADLPPGLYPFGGALVWVQPGNEVTFFTADGGIALAERPDQLYTVRIGKFADSSMFRTDAAERVSGLRIEASAPHNPAMRGLLGTPDGDSTNEFQLADGQAAADYAVFTEHWRVKTKAESLFTYAEGQGPGTFNKDQDVEPPTDAQLESYVQQIQALLTGECKFKPEQLAALDPVIIRNMAYDLAARAMVDNPNLSESERLAEARAMLLARGLCADAGGWIAAYTATQPTGVFASGQLTLQGQPGVGLAGARVVVSSPAFEGPLCDTTTLADGQFACGKHTAAITDTDSIDLVYRISGYGQPFEQTFTVAAPRSGEPVSDRRFFSAPAQRVLRLRGQVFDPAGLPLPGALVQVSGPQRLWTTASITGAYTLDYPLPDDLTQTVLRYEAADPAGASYVSVQAPFQTEASTRGLLPITRDLTTQRGSPPSGGGGFAGATKRYVLVGGLVTDGLITDRKVPVGGVQVQLSGPALSRPCATTTDASGFYQCEADLLPTFNGAAQDLALTLAFSGAGSRTETLSIPGREVPAADASGAVVRAVSVALSATTLQLKGVVRLNGTLQANAIVEVRNPATGLSVSGRTGADGSYDLALALPDQVVQSGGLELRYRATFGDRATTATQTLDAVQPNQISPVTQNLDLNGLTVVFAGRVTNKWVAGLGAPGARVQIRSATGDELCDVQSDTSGLYRCEVTLPDSAAFNVIYTISGRGDLVSPALPVDPADPLSLIRTLAVDPPTLDVTGLIRDSAGDVRANVQVGLDAAGAGVQVKTDAYGRYHAYLALPGDLENGTLVVSAYYQEGLVIRRASTSVELPSRPSGLVVLPVSELKLDGPFLDPAQTAKLHLHGRIVNQTEPASDLAGLPLTIKAGVYGELCRTTTSPDGSYDCPERELPQGGTLTLAYSLDGYADPLNHTATIQPGGAVNDLPFSPAFKLTTVVASGTVRDAADQPLTGVLVSFSGVFEASTVSSTEGAYFYARPVLRSALQGELTTTVHFDSGSRTAAQSYTGEVGGRIALPPPPLKPALVLDSTSVEAGLDAGATGSAELKLSNTGNTPLTLGLTVSDPINTTWLSLPESSVTLAPGAVKQAVTLNLDAAGLIDDTYLASILIDSVSPPYHVAVLVELRVKGTPQLAVTPAALEFGSVYLGKTATKNLELRNTGTAALQITSAASSISQLQIDPVSRTLQPGERLSVAARFTPSGLAPVSGQITIQSSAGPVTVSATGSGTNIPTVELSLPSYSVTLSQGSSMTQGFWLHNHGAAPLTWSFSGRSNAFIDPSQGTAPAGGSEWLTLVLDTANLGTGVHHLDLVLTTDNPQYSQISFPITMTITPWESGPPDDRLDPDQPL